MKFQPHVLDVETIFNDLFMKHFEFVLDNTVLRSGRLKLFSLKEFNLKFFLVNDKQEIKQFEIPYPFDLIKTNNGYIFDYTIDSLSSLNDLSYLNYWEEQSTPKSKLYDKKLYLKIK